jgi:hypothetical protein
VLREEMMMEKQPVLISAGIFEGLEAVRQSGYTNMFDRPRVIELAEMMGYEETAEWLHENRNLYAQGIFQGFKVIEEGDASCAD